MIALVLLPAGLCAMDDEAFRKGFDKAVQQCNPGSQKKSEEWKRLAIERAAAHQQEQQRQRQLQQEKFNHGMNG